MGACLDIEVALNPTATIPPAEMDLLWRRLDRVATRFRDSGTLTRLAPSQVASELTDSRRIWCLDLGGELHIVAFEPGDPTATVWGPAEAVLRLLYGRNHPNDHVTAAGAVTMEDLRSLFLGY